MSLQTLLPLDEKTREIKDKIKFLLKELKGSESSDRVEKLKSEFRGILKEATPMVIVTAESELAAEGFTQQDLMTACDIHLELLRDAIDNPDLKPPEGHPVRRFQEEHKVIVRLLDGLRTEISLMKKKNGLEEASDNLVRVKAILDRLMEAESHNVRQENTLFPVLEKHGVADPPAIMWAEHLDQKADKKQMLGLLEKRSDYDFKKLVQKLDGLALGLYEKFANHSRKENNILYAVALEVITGDEWKDIAEECDALGYFALDPV
jgi:DUF438 domain-containing protein